MLRTLESPSWIGLNGTSFDVEASLDKSPEQIVDDVKYWYLEFLQKLSVIPFDLNIEYLNGERTVFCPRFKSRWLDITNQQERGGAVYQTIAQIENYLRNSPTNSMVFFTSPPGWTGLQDTEGNWYEDYKNTQTFCYKIEDGHIESVTLVSDMNLKQNARFLEKFEAYLNSNPQDKHHHIQEIVSKPVFLDGSYDFTDIIATIQEVIGTDNVRQNVSFNEIYSQLKNRKELARIDHTEINRLISQFASFAKNNKDNSLLRHELSKLILDISAAFRGAGEEEKSQSGFYAEEHTRVQSLEGPCLKRGGQGAFIINGIPRLVVGNKEIIKCVECPFCKEIVDAEIYDGKIHCPKCKQEASLNTNQVA